ncbi:MAG: N-acetylmuramoyl-L-alanine amidase [Ferruginibacter sp.]|nr:N-acetylmuramoyl-L-alanine amidase [Ferruginibacter sp.]
MLATALYLLKVIICSGILFAYYWLMLRNKIFHQYNRFYLLATILLSLALPLISIDIWHNADQPAPGAIKILQAVNSSDEYLDEIVVTANQNSFSAEQALSVVYLLTSLIFLGASIFALLKIRWLFVKNRHRLLGRIFFVNTTALGTPFSFLKCIFWNDHIDPESTTGKQIFLHELAHVQQRHTYDKLFMNAVLIFTWCNPFFWLIRKELNMIHEFLADKIAVEDSDTEAFAAMILQAAYPQHQFKLTNPFFYSPIKRRLMMLTKNRNPKVGYIGRLLVLPLTVLIFAAFTLKTKTFKESVANYDGTPITVVIDAGHGGQDGGATGFNGTVMEKDLALEISKKISALNANKKINIVLTRTTDVYQTPDAKASFGKEQNADLFISLHLNPLKTGLEVIVADKTSSKADQSTVLASAIINEFNQGFKLPVSQQPKQAQMKIKVLNAATCPAVLIEAGNITSEKDLAYLSNGGMNVIAEKVLRAVEKFAVSLKRKAAQTETAVTELLQNMNEPQLDTVPKVVIKGKDNALIIVDGKIVSHAEMAKISPESISKVNVLKGQAAVSKYGSKGKDGVVIVTTKNKEISFNDLNVTIQSDSTKIEHVRLENVRISHAPGESPLSQPIYFVDGVELEEKNLLEKVNPNDISELNIIKEKMAIEKYGPRAINGVIEVHTKNKIKLNITEGKTDRPLDEVVVVGYGSKTGGQLPDDKVFSRTEEAPTFPGGDEAWKKYLMEHLKAGIPVQEGWNTGVYKIVVSFIVRKDGTVADIKTDDFPGSKTAEHCIELIRNGPKWNPAVQNGHAVNAYKKQPITFVVSDQKGL